MQTRSSLPIIQPVGQYVTVQLLPEEAPSPLAVGVPRLSDLTQKAIILALGQGIHDLTVGDTVLCRPMSGQIVGDDCQMLLPSEAIIATVDVE